MRNRDYIQQNIKYIREEHNITQKEFARRIGRTANAVSNWEVGFRSPKLEDVVKICEVFNIGINEMIGEDMNITKSSSKERKINYIFGLLSDKAKDEIIKIAETFALDEGKI